MATVVLEKVTKVYENGFEAVHGLDLDVAEGEFMVLVGTIRLRQDHRPAHGGRTGRHHGGDAADRRQGRQQPVAERARHRHGLPELRPLPPHDGGPEHRLRPQSRQATEDRDRREGPQRGRDPRADGVVGAQARPALGWPTSAGRHGPGHRPGAVGVPDGRAAVQPRRQATGPDASRSEPHPAPPRRGDHVRHPRPGRGHDHGRPGGGHERRPPAADATSRRSSTSTRTTSSWPPSSALRP